MDKEGRAVLRAILKLDDSDAKAHELLGEILYDGKWFPNEKKIEEYKKKALETEAKKTGKVIYKGELVDPADLPYLEKGMRRLENGKWVSAEEYQRVTEGWVQQDLEWIAPAEIPNVEKGLWKCGDKWLTVQEADEYHSEIGKWWRVPSDHFVLYSTCKRELTQRALDECEHTYKEISRALGKVPADRVAVLLLNSRDQYGRFARADDGQPVELRGFSSLHGAFLAEIWAEPLRHGMPSAGVAYWDTSNADEEAFGRLYLRHAAAQSLVEGVDPSPKLLQQLAAGNAGNAPDQAFWSEKQIPAWLRYGVVGYAERYFADSLVGAGGDPMRFRKWAISNIAGKGGLDPLDSIFALGLTLDDPLKSAKLMNEAGLLVAFVLDGKCAPVAARHGAFKDALKGGKDVKDAAKELADEIKKNESELRKFAGL
jgi:hypothetical protein